MGFFDKIKKVYNKVDTKLGGYLPGGQTPQEVKQPVQPQPVQPITTIPSAQEGDNVTVQDLDRVAKAPSTTTVKSDVSGGKGIPVQSQPTVPQEQTGTQELPIGVDLIQRQKNIDAERVLDSSPGNSYITITGEYLNPFFSPEGQKERFTNMGNTLNSAFNPFAQRDVQSNVNNVQTKWLTEAAGNNPYETALYLTGAKTAYTAVDKLISSSVKLGKSLVAGETLFGETIIGEVAASATGKQVLRYAGEKALNPKSARLIIKSIVPTARALFKNPFVVIGLLGTMAMTIPFSENPRGDAVLALGIAIAEANKIGDLQSAEEMTEMLEDLTNDDAWDKTAKYIPGVNLFKGEKEKRDAIVLTVKASNRAADIKRDKLIADSIIEEKVKNGTATPEDIEAYSVSNPNSAIAFQRDEDIQTELKNEIKAGRLGAGQEIADRILYDKMSAYDIINDEEIKSFALDPNNQFSAITKLYTEATAAIGRGNFFGSGGGGRTINEPPSTLNFGLLQTGGETRQEKIEQEVPEGTTSLNERALELFGIPYAQLTKEQKEQL